MLNRKKIFNYKKLSNRKKTLITKEFCIDFKNNLIQQVIEKDKNNEIEIDYFNKGYLDFYHYLEGSNLFYSALEETCIKYNIVKAIYEYLKKMSWYDSDLFKYELMIRMIELDVIPYISKDFEEIDDSILENLIKCTIVYHYYDKGYDVVKYEFWDKTDKDALEILYTYLPNVEIFFSN